MPSAYDRVRGFGFQNPMASAGAGTMAQGVMPVQSSGVSVNAGLSTDASAQASAMVLIALAIIVVVAHIGLR